MTASEDDNDPLTCSLEGTDASSFDIDSSLGQIKTLAEDFLFGPLYGYRHRTASPAGSWTEVLS